MRKELESIRPSAKIVQIENHKKGPVYTVSQIYDLIPDDEEVIVCYCDVYSDWDYEHFLKLVREKKADGAVPSHKGFHPHMLGTDNYAFMRDEDNWMIEIQEKKPFTNNRMNEYASNGTYYFRTGAIMKKSFSQLIENDIKVKGEYFVSCAYNFLAQDGLKVFIYEIDHILHLGTPKDVEEYQQWSSFFQAKTHFHPEPWKGGVILPMAGRGSRFEGSMFTGPKPFIEVDGYPMYISALSCLPKSLNSDKIVIALREHEAMMSSFKKSTVFLPDVTNGQASTCLHGVVHFLKENKPFVVGACDSGLIFDSSWHDSLLEQYDILVWTIRNNQAVKINPNMYTYVKNDGTRALEISMKKPVSEKPDKDHALIGFFSFKNPKDYIDAYSNLIINDNCFNNEFYIDSLVQEAIDMGKKVGIFPVTHSACWGTPEDLQTYLYWQRFFHKCDWHPYSIDHDPMFSNDEEVIDRYKRDFTISTYDRNRSMLVGESLVFISHRGNINGPELDRENHPDFVDEAIAKGYKVEIDVRKIGEKLFLGHDECQYEVDLDWLVKRKEYILIHAKNVDALIALKSDFEVFYHISDNHTIISNSKYVWTHNLNDIRKHSIIPLIDKVFEIDNFRKQKFSGVCSDYIAYYKEQFSR